jgi:tetratricopeptide (TPR) repeat protein
MGLFDIFRKKKKRKDIVRVNENANSSGDSESVTVYGFVSDNIEASNAMSLDEAEILHQRFNEQMVQSDDLQSKSNFAASLMMSGQFDLCIKAYQKIADQYPERLGMCEAQIGAALYFLGHYEEAIRYYKQALGHGADADMMQDNIEEAEEAIANRG